MLTTLDLDFLCRFLINTLSITALVFSCYAKSFSIGDSRKREHATSFMMFGVGVFIVTYLLSSATISMGFAFGLFAVFSMLRYRTESISVKEMTYLFLVIAMSLLSAVSNTNLIELIALQVITYACARICNALLSGPDWLEQQIKYERIDNIKPQNQNLLLTDLKTRTGLDIQDVEIGAIDFVRDTAELRVFYAPQKKCKVPSRQARPCSSEAETPERSGGPDAQSTAS